MPKIESIIKFAKKFIPKNWQIEKLDVSLFEDLIEGKRKGFYIFPHISIKDVKGEDNLGRVEHISFSDKGSWVKLWLFSHYKKSTYWQATVVHELAHIAVDRLFAMKKKEGRQMGIINSSVDLEKIGEDQHERYFIWAYELLCNRLGKSSGSATEFHAYMENLHELECFKNKIKDNTPAAQYAFEEIKSAKKGE